MIRHFAGFALAATLTFVAQAALAGPRYELEVNGLVCPFCAYAIEKSLRDLPGVTAIEIHVRGGVVELEAADGQQLTHKQVRAAIERAGFSLAGFQQLDDGNDGR